MAHPPIMKGEAGRSHSAGNFAACAQRHDGGEALVGGRAHGRIFRRANAAVSAEQHKTNSAQNIARVAANGSMRRDCGAT